MDSMVICFILLRRIGYIEKLHKDRVLSERMSRFSRTFYEDNFTINKMIDALVSVYDKLNFL